MLVVSVGLFYYDRLGGGPKKRPPVSTDSPSTLVLRELGELLSK